MEQVIWNPNLPFSSQHPCLRILVQEIFDQAAKTKFFHPNEYIKPPELNPNEFELVERDMLRSSVFRVSKFGAEQYCTNKDVEYPSRDRIQKKARGQQAYEATWMVESDREVLARSISSASYALIRRGYFWNAVVKGPGDFLDKSELRYDEKWLRHPSTFLTDMWCQLHSSLALLPFNKFDIAMWLSATAFAESADMRVIQAFAAFYRLPNLKSISVPSASEYKLRLGESMNIMMIEAFVKSRARSFEASQKFSLAREEGEGNAAFQARKRSTFQEMQSDIILSFSSELMQQWPCEKPQTPDTEDANVFLRVESLMDLVRRRFKYCLDNRRFEQYFDEVWTMVSQQKVVEFPEPEHRIATGNMPDRGK